MRESTVEKYLVKRVKALGGEVRKVQWIGRRGAPDRLVGFPAHPDGECRRVGTTVFLGAFSVWAELKRPGEVAEPHQAREHERMRRLGMRIVVLDSIEAVDKFLEGVN